ncbi:MAG: carbohydrate kinase family protein [Anaerolineales bacterium]
MEFPSLVIAGQLRRDYLLPPPPARPLIDAPGGNLLYAAAGARLWNAAPGLLARVGEEYPREWLRQFQQRGFDTQGIKILPETLDLRNFLAYSDLASPQRSSPVSHFIRLGLPFPKNLLGYQPESQQPVSLTRQNPDSPKLLDIPPAYRQAKAVHLAPLDYASHTQLAPQFRQWGASIVTIEPCPEYMNGNYLTGLRSLLQGVTAFLPAEEDLRALFWGRSDDLWQMAAELGSYGAEFIVVKRGARGQFIYEQASGRKWEIPAYPAQIADPTHAGDAFCGGFLAGYAESFDPVQAALRGNIAASLAIEGSGAFYALDALPGLAEARLNFLAEMVKEL